MANRPLDAAEELKNFLDSFFSVAASIYRPPRYPVDPVCKDAFFSAETLDGWTWRTCSELVMPIGRGNNDTMFLGF
ncbi:hypothetical protein Peur_006620 [Populus x canadensis]